MTRQLLYYSEFLYSVVLILFRIVKLFVYEQDCMIGRMNFKNKENFKFK